ncbi:MAG: hypothetical protein ACXWZS_18520 [Gemmatirosa sp.]
MTGSLRSVLAAGAFALALAPAALRAQAAPAAAQGAAADSLVFPRQFVQWVMSTQGDSAFAHAGPRLRESMQSADGVNAMAARIAARFGDVQGTDAEVQFDEGPLKVYIAVMRFAHAPEPGAWVVAYVPGTKVVERASFGPASSVKGRYPQAKLP